MNSAPLNAPRWYHEPWAMGVVGLFCPPLGFILFISAPGQSLKNKVVLFACVALLSGLAGWIEYVDAPMQTALRNLAAGFYYEPAATLYREGRYEEASLQLEKVLELLPEKSSVRRRLAQCFRNLGKFRDARRQLVIARKCLDDWSYGRIGIELELADVLMEMGKYKAADFTLKNVTEHAKRSLSDLPGYLLVRGRLLLHKGDYQAASSEIRRLLSSYRSEFFGKAYEILADIESARGNELRRLYFLCEALRYCEGSRHAERAILECAAELGRPLIPFRAYIRVMRFRRDGFGARIAAPVLQRIVDRFPGFVFADGCIYTAAYCLYEHIGDYRRALRLYERVAERYPQSESLAKALWQASLCYKKMGMKEERIQALKRLVAETGRSSLRDEARYTLWILDSGKRKRKGQA